MSRRFIAALMLLLLIVSIIASAFMIQPVGAAGTIYIRANGSIEPSGAPIASSDNATYILTNSTSDSIYIERSNIIFHGNSYSMLGSGSGVGIDLNGVGNVTVEDIRIVGYQWGIYIRNSMLRNSIVQNYLAANQYGIFVSLAHNNIVSDNDVVNCTHTGIYLSYSTNNTIFRNDIETNYVGIDIQSASNNKFYHNNLIRNSLLQASIITNASQSPNVWDYGYPTCGNYWSNYNGTDSKSGPFQNEIGADAVGDTSYDIDSNNTDGYPLVNPWSTNFTVFNHMVVGYGSKPMTLDPARAMMVADEELLMNVYEPLIFYDEEKTDQFVPRLATSWIISPDGLTYTFNIRQGVKFHNNEILKPEDVEYSLERIFIIESGLAGWMFYEAFFNVSGSRDEQGHFRVTGQQLADAVTSTDTAVSLHLTTPYPPLLQILAQPWVSILCKKWCIQIGDWPGTFSNWTLYNLPATTAIETQSTLPPGPRTNAMCGTGPFMLDYYDNETSLQWQLVKFDGYWGGWPANGADGFLKRITGKIIYDWETRKNSFLDGQLDSLQVPRAGVDEVLGQPGVSSIYPLEQLVCDALLFTFNISTSSPFMGVPGGLPKGTLSESGIPPDFFTDINVRKGFAYAFNYSKLITEAIRGEASQPATPILPGLPYYNPAQEKYSTDLTKAALCFNASWSGQLWTSGFNFTITYNPQNTIRQKACEIIKVNVESLNSKFHIQIQSVSYNNYCDFVQNHSFPMFSFGWLADYADPHDFAYGYMYSKGAFAQWQLYSNSTIDALVQQGITTMNDTARRQAYYDLQTAYHQDCPSVPLYQPVGRRFQRDWVQGWYYNPLLSDNYFYSEWKGDMSKSTRYSWDMFHHDPTHIGYSDSAAPGTNQKLWSYTTSGEVHSSPAVADGKVYVGSLDNSVYCLDALTGAKVWNYTTGNSVWSSPAVADGKVYVGSNDNRLYCLDALTGAQIWNYTTGNSVWSSPAVADGVVFIGSFDSGVYAFGNTIRVPQDYATIQAAINAAAPGATIWIAPGTYNEPLVINKTITLIGKIGSEPTFNGGGSGIAITIVSSGSGSTIAGITITSWDQGIVINGASGCKVYDNIMSLINQNGIALEGSTASNNQIYSNIFQQDTVAITLTASSTSNIVFNNIITSNSIGLDVESSGNVVCANMMTENQVAISIKNSNNNKFFHNDFVSNDVQLVIAASTGNVWDDGYPSGGNYWSDHTGPDMFSGPNQDQAGSDGIVDTSYTIATGSVDRYPLAHGAHDVGITSVSASKTVVGKGCTLHVELRILNYGTYDENFPVAAYANTSTAVTQSIALTKGSYIIVTLTWNTSSFAYGNYTVSAYALPVQDETNTADNNMTGGSVFVTIPGDINGDGTVNILDAIKLGNAFLATPGTSNWNPNADINDDNIVNILDAIILANHFLQHYP